MIFLFRIVAKSGFARRGVFSVNGRSVDSPFFMPVATFGAGKGIGPDDYSSLGVQAVIANSFLLSSRPGVDVIKAAGGLHSFMGFDGLIFTDSGGFQAARSKIHVRTTNNGVHLRDPFDRSTRILSPESVMKVQEALGSDVAMVIDDMALPGSSPKRFSQALARTSAWASRSIALRSRSDQLLFGIVQGGYSHDLRVLSASQITALPFDGFAIGGCAIGESKEEMWVAVSSTVPLLPEDKVRYLMGVGNPADIVVAVSLGVDCFDSIFPTSHARHNSIFTFDGPFDLGKSQFKSDFSPLDPGCDCFVCRNFSRAYIHHLSRINNPLAARLKQVHNVRFMMRLMARIREAISAGSYDSFMSSFLRSWFRGHVPRSYSSFLVD